MTHLFPINYEKKYLGQKEQLTQHLQKEQDFTALNIALHAHEIHAYLKQQGADNPNHLLVSALRYAATALGVSYLVIEEAFYTRTPLTEDQLYAVSYGYNKDVPAPQSTQQKPIELTIDFWAVVKNVFQEHPSTFWATFRKADVLVASTDPKSYDLAALFQAVLQEVWLKVKAALKDSSEKEITHARKEFMIYFYSDDQRYYRKETKEKLVALFIQTLTAQGEGGFVIDQKLQELLDQGASLKVVNYLQNHWENLTQAAYYQRFLRGISKTSNLSLFNHLLLLEQKWEVVPVKQVHDWIHNHRTLIETAQPIFLFGKKEPVIDPDTGEILQAKRLSLTQHEALPIIPYFEVTATEGRAQEPFEATPQQIFVAIEKMTSKKIVFATVSESEWEEDTLRLKSGQNETQTLTDLVVLLTNQEKTEKDPLIQFENRSVTDVILMVFGLEPIPLDYTTLENLQHLKNGKIYVERLYTQVVHRSEHFLGRLKERLQEIKDPIKEPEVRPSLEEEIQNAIEFQQNVIANLATVRSNQAEQENSLTKQIEKSSEQTQATTEGNDQDGNN